MKKKENITNVFDTILLANNFVKKRGAYGIRMYYHKKKDFYASIDDICKIVNVFKDDDLIVQGRDYKGYSIADLIQYLKDKGYESNIQYCGGVVQFV